MAVKGYYYCKSDQRYKAKVKIKGVVRYLGNYIDPEDAAKAYQKFKLKQHAS